jgi:hypothetical protein
LAKDSQLKDFSSAVRNSGEGRCTIEVAIEEGSSGGNAAGAKDIHAIDGEIGRVEDFLVDDAG